MSSTLRFEWDLQHPALSDELRDEIMLAAKEQTALQLYARGVVSSGFAARLLGLPRFEFLQLAAKQQIPTVHYTEQERKEENELVQRLAAEYKLRRSGE